MLNLILRAPATKCPRDETTGDEVSPRRNGRRRSVPATKWLATKSTREKMSGDEMYPRRTGGDETAATKSPAPHVGSQHLGTSPNISICLAGLVCLAAHQFFLYHETGISL